MVFYKTRKQLCYIVYDEIKKIIFSFYFRGFFAAILIAALVYKIGLEELRNTLRLIAVYPLLLMVLSTLVIFFLGATNLLILITSLTDRKISSFYKKYSTAWALGLLMPSQVGDASLVLILKKQGIPVSQTITAYFFDKIVTLIPYSLISIAGLFMFSGKISVNSSSIQYILLGTIGVIISIVSIITCSSLWISFCSYFSRFKESLILILKKKRIVMVNVLITLLKVVVTVTNFSIAFRMVGESVAAFDIAIITIMSSLVGYLPLSLAGIGTVEFSAIYLFGSVGVGESAVFSVYILMRLINYIIATVIFLLPSNNIKAQ